MSPHPHRRSVCNLFILVFCVALLASGCATRRGNTTADPLPPDPDPQKEKPGWGHRVVYYIPNRALDMADLLRLRLRGGKGWAVNARLTEPMTFFAGSYESYYVGFPGPRYPHKTKAPFGYEEYLGIQLSIADATDESPHEPGYGYTEFVFGGHLYLVGADVGTDPYEWYDLLAGLLFLDPRGDDL